MGKILSSTLKGTEGPKVHTTISIAKYIIFEIKYKIIFVAQQNHQIVL